MRYIASAQCNVYPLHYKFLFKFLFIFLSILFLSLMFLSFTGAETALADSPPNLSTDIPWQDRGGVFDVVTEKFDAAFNGVEDTMLAFNRARRQEEIALGLVNGRLGTLDLPVQAQWDSFSDGKKAFFIINEARVARAGMLPDIIGLPLEGLEEHISKISQTYAEFLVETNNFDHMADGIGPASRIDNDLVLGGCHEFLSRSENLSAFWYNTLTPLYIERALYNWLYADASSAWKHREALLLQDLALGNDNPLAGFQDNVGLVGREGFMGVGVVHSAAYDPFGVGEMGIGTIVVLNLFDPKPDNENCPWDQQDEGPDSDADGDGIARSIECPENLGDGESIELDMDGDGFDNCQDFDSDGDGLTDLVESQPSGVMASQDGSPVDSDGDGSPDYLDLDSDDDGIPDKEEGFDMDSDGLPNILPSTVDRDRNGLDDAYEIGDMRPIDSDGDGQPNWRDEDDDGDGVPTKTEIEYADPAGEGAGNIPSYLDSAIRLTGPTALEESAEPILFLIYLPVISE